MHSGNLKKILFTLSIIVLAISSCKDSKDKAISFVSPLEGSRVISGETLLLKTDAEPNSFDSIKYSIDGRFVGTMVDTQAVKFPTAGFPFGGRLISAVIYHGTDSTELNTNIQLLPSKPPVKLNYTIVNTYPHDTSSYTQGLEFHDGILYESDGLRGESSLRKVDVKTGKVLKKVDIPQPYFAEGITVIGNKIIMLTYQEKVGFVFDKNTFQKLAEFPYTSGTQEGWGLAFSGTHILNTDGSNTIYLLNKDTYQIQKTLEVYDNNGPVDSLNELEIVNGKIYANIYMQDKIVIINPETGGVEAEVDLQKLAPYSDRAETGFVLNGIAYDAKNNRLFVTGKKWNKLYEIKIM